MAIIIGAIGFIFIAICGYVLYNVNKVRKKERNFYDIFFVTQFIIYLIKNKLIKQYIGPNDTIKVFRRVQCLKNLSELNTKERKIESVYDLRKQNQTETKNKPIYCLTYEFMLSDKNIVFCVILGILPNVMLRYIKNTSFTLNVDAQRRKIVPKDSFTGKIFINSDKSIFQSLKFIFQVEEQQLNDFYGFFKGIETRSETEIIISYLKTFLYQY